MALIGNLEQFEAEKHEVGDYLERMEQFFIVNAIEEGMKVPMLITLIGPGTYNVLKNLLSPAKPASKTFKELTDALMGYYVIKKSAVAGRYEFYNCKQKQGQTINEFMVEIKRKASFCDFGAFLNEALRDRLVCGINSDRLTKKLLTVGDKLSFEEAVKIATAYESAEKETKNIQPETIIQSIQNSQIRNQSRAVQRNNPGGACSRCGGNHPSDKCFKRSWICFKCQRPGHLASKCHFRISTDKKVVRQVGELNIEERAADDEDIVLGRINMIDDGDEAAWADL